MGEGLTHSLWEDVAEARETKGLSQNGAASFEYKK